MKRYNWEYNGETMGLVERENGICVLYSDIAALRAEVEHARNNADNLELERDDMAARVGELEDDMRMITSYPPDFSAPENFYRAAQTIASSALSIPTPSASRLRDEMYAEILTAIEAQKVDVKSAGGDFDKVLRWNTKWDTFRVFIEAIRARKSIHKPEKIDG